MYKIIGVDGKEYGPVNLDQLKQWVHEGRVNARTLVQAAGTSDWKACGEIPELSSLAVPPVVRPANPGTEAPPALARATEPRGRQGLAISSFALGIVSFVLCLGILTGIPAIICGHVARNRARRLAGEYGGTGLATVGVLLGYLSVVYTLLILVLLLPVVGNSRMHSQLTVCNSHMKQIGLALRVWGVDHEGHFPFNVSTNAGGTRELCQTGPNGFDSNAPAHLALIGNELGSPDVLVCPLDTSKQAARNFAGLKPENLSYLLRTGPDVTDTNLEEILLKCPLHGTLLRCDGSVEVKVQGRKLRL